MKAYVITNLMGDFRVTVVAAPEPDYPLPYFLASCVPCAGRPPALDLALSILADFNGETLTEHEDWIYLDDTKRERVFTYTGVQKLANSWAWNLHRDFAERFLGLVELLSITGLTITAQQIRDWLEGFIGRPEADNAHHG